MQLLKMLRLERQKTSTLLAVFSFFFLLFWSANIVVSNRQIWLVGFNKFTLSYEDSAAMGYPYNSRLFILKVGEQFDQYCGNWSLALVESPHRDGHWSLIYRNLGLSDADTALQKSLDCLETIPIISQLRSAQKDHISHHHPEHVQELKVVTLLIEKIKKVILQGQLPNTDYIKLKETHDTLIEDVANEKLFIKGHKTFRMVTLTDKKIWSTIKIIADCFWIAIISAFCSIMVLSVFSFRGKQKA